MRRRALLMGGQSIKKPSLYWKFDVDTLDYITGYNLNLVNPADPLFVPGKIGNSINWEGEVARGLRSPNVWDGLKFHDTNGDLPFSISVWVRKTESNGVSGEAQQAIRNTIIGVTGTSTYTSYWCLGVDSVTDQVIFYKKSASSSQKRTIKTDTPILRNEWVLIQYIDGGIGSEKFYINGLEEFSVITDTGYTSMKDNTLDAYGQGISLHSQANYVGVTLRGQFDDLAVWKNHLLTEKEIETIWNNGIGRKIR